MAPPAPAPRHKSNRRARLEQTTTADLTMLIVGSAFPGALATELVSDHRDVRSPRGPSVRIAADESPRHQAPHSGGGTPTRQPGGRSQGRTRLSRALTHQSAAHARALARHHLPRDARARRVSIPGVSRCGESPRGSQRDFSAAFRQSSFGCRSGAIVCVPGSRAWPMNGRSNAASIVFSSEK